MAVIGFDPVIAIRARPLPTMLPHAALDLQFSNRRWITSQPVSGKHVWRWIVRIGHRSSQEQLGGFAIARLRQVEVDLGWSPGLRQTVKTLLTVRCKFIVADPGTDLGWACR